MDGVPVYVHNLIVLIGIMLLISLLERYKDKLANTQEWTLSKNSFFIYCMHGIFTGFVIGLLSKAMSLTQYPFVYLITQTIILFGVIATLCLFSKIAKKIIPAVYLMLSGGR